TSKIKNFDTEISKIERSIANFDDFDAFGLPATGYYWELLYKKEVVHDEQYRFFIKLLDFSEDIRNFSNNSEEFAKVRNMMLQLQHKYDDTFTKLKWEQKEKAESDKMLRLSQKISTKAQITFNVTTTNNAKIHEANLKIFRFEDGGKHNLCSRKIPIPYAFGTSVSNVKFRRNLKYSSIDEIVTFWVEGGISFNQITLNRSFPMEPGDYLLRIEVNFLDEPLFFGFKLENMEKQRIKLIIPHENFFNHNFSCIPGIEFRENNKTQSISPFYVAKSQVFLDEYLKFLNDRKNPKELFSTPEKLLPVLDDNTSAVKFDEKKQIIVPLEYQAELKPVSGINYTDILQYVNWLNAKKDGKGTYSLLST
ncbi:MAG: hypothetical protein KAR20_08430, partial [Candidatus Heimdallarchaeota archaeon]|nr:hypothetical protein [Candidatus Heimdallarchaeota archaeon]